MLRYYCWILLLCPVWVRSANDDNNNNNSGAEAYLHDTITSLKIQKQIKPIETQRRRFQLKKENNNQIRNSNSNEYPALTKAELHSMYETALTNGNTLQNQKTAVYTLLNNNDVEASSASSANNNKKYHYQYYYYPLSSILGNQTTAAAADADNLHVKHQHSVNVAPIKTIVETSGKNKALEPLFMAISSFIGMAVMFMFSMVLWPRFTGHKRRKRITPKQFDDFHGYPLPYYLTTHL